MTRIKLISRHPEHMLVEHLKRPYMVQRLKDSGYTFSNRNPDVLLFHTYNATPKDKECLEEKHIPIMILEKVDCAGINFRNALCKDNVVGLLKPSTYKDPRINNSAFRAGDKNRAHRHHHKLIFESMRIKESYHSLPKINEKYFEKIELWYNYAVASIMAPLVKEVISYKSRRPIDVEFHGTTKYGPHGYPLAVTKHRQICIQQMRKLKNVNISIAESRSLSRPQYYKTLFNTKIAISPWGLGERCYRDFEAIYAGCIMIKPDTSFVMDWSDTYEPKNHFYVPCRPNFSDLQVKVNQIIQQWSSKREFRKSARDRMLEYCSREKIADQVIQSFDRCISRIKT